MIKFFGVEIQLIKWRRKWESFLSRLYLIWHQWVMLVANKRTKYHNEIIWKHYNLYRKNIFYTTCLRLHNLNTYWMWEISNDLGFGENLEFKRCYFWVAKPGLAENPRGNQAFLLGEVGLEENHGEKQALRWENTANCYLQGLLNLFV